MSEDITFVKPFSMTCTIQKSFLLVIGIILESPEALLTGLILSLLT